MGFAVLLVVGIALWMFSMSLDKGRITDYIQQRGGRIVSVNWAPFGRGWFGEKNDRIFEVVYIDSAGKEHFATCKTSLFSGVYWTEDRVAHGKPQWYDSASPGNEPGKPLISQIPKADVESEVDEVQRLREENARLRAQLGIAGKCPACGATISPDDARCPDCKIALK
jgi:hypothetical protein